MSIPQNRFVTGKRRVSLSQSLNKGMFLRVAISPQKFLSLSLIIFLILSFAICFAQPDIEKNEIAGELFGAPVPIGNYYFAKKVVLSFNAKWRGIPQTEEELEDLVWQELLFSYEAFRRGIKATDTEVNEQIDKILKSEKVEFNWKQDTKAFKEWVEEKLRMSLETFRNQIEHLVKLEKLRQQVLDSIEPEVTEEEAYQKFLNEYNTLSVELIRFDELEEAERFYKEIKENPGIWAGRKEKEPESFKRPGFVALDFLIHMWGFKKEDAYKMIEMQEGSFYPPAPIYKGYAVFKILKIRKAEPREFDKRRESYFGKMRMIKKHEGFKDWAKQLKEQANIKVFIK